MSNLDKFLKVIERLMSLASAFFLGGQLMANKAKKAEAEKVLAETENKEAQIDLEVEKSRSGRTAGDIIRDNIARGRNGSDDPESK